MEGRTAWRYRMLAGLALLVCAARAADAAPAPAPDAGPPAAATLDAALALPPALRVAWLDALARRDGAPTRVQRLADFVLDPVQGLGVRYRADANHAVAQTYATREANCLAYTLLFVALAREAGLPAGAQEIRATLSWDQREGTVYRNSHVNAWVRIGARRYVLDATPDAYVARHAARPMRDASLLAHYWNNLAMARLAHGDPASALPLMQAALALDPRATHWSNTGVLRLRLGDAEGAAQAYAEALRREPDSFEALFNSASLAQRRGDALAAAAWRARLAQVEQRDPFHHFLRALDYERAGDLPRAIEHYRRATRLQRGEARFHAALAQAYARAGDASRAAREAARAAALRRR